MLGINLSKYPTEDEYDLACEAAAGGQTVVLHYGDSSYICRTEKDVHEQWQIIQELVEFNL